MYHNIWLSWLVYKLDTALWGQGLCLFLPYLQYLYYKVALKPICWINDKWNPTPGSDLFLYCRKFVLPEVLSSQLKTLSEFQWLGNHLQRLHVYVEHGVTESQVYATDCSTGQLDGPCKHHLEILSSVYCRWNIFYVEVGGWLIIEIWLVVKAMISF